MTKPRTGKPASKKQTEARSRRPNAQKRRKPARTQKEPPKLAKKATRRPKKAPARNPGDLKRPAPDEPVRIQPPPELVRGRHDSSLEERAAPPQVNTPAREVRATPPQVNARARETETAKELSRLRDDPERKRGADRSALDPNRWVHQRSTAPGGGRWQAHHPSNRGR